MTDTLSFHLIWITHTHRSYWLGSAFCPRRVWFFESLLKRCLKWILVLADAMVSCRCFSQIQLTITFTDFSHVWLWLCSSSSSEETPMSLKRLPDCMKELWIIQSNPSRGFRTWTYGNSSAGRQLLYCCECTAQCPKSSFGNWIMFDVVHTLIPVR